MSGPGRVRIVPLGGLGEIGMNCMAVEAGDDIVVVDCGVTFPKTDLGIDTYYPDFSWLEARRDRVRAVLITHGHEDHIGALPYFLERFEVPVYGPAYALELARLRLDERGFGRNDVDLVVTKPRGRFRAGGFEIEPVRVTHSIADATALVLRTPAGTLVHTGDFKLDPSPSDGEVTDEARFRELGDEGVRLLLSDSTNVDSHGASASESVAARVLLGLVEGYPNRVIVGLFGSNVHRLHALGEVAMATGRKLVLLGRSVQTHVRAAMEQGRLNWPVDLVAAPEQAAALPRRKVLALATGTQSERLAALARLAARAHPLMTIDEGDRVVLSSRIIPGNEPAVMTMVGDLLRLGADVRTASTDPGVHVSGHAYRDEQSRMIDWVRPRGFLPVHGTLHHLHRHARLAAERGVSEVVVIENGEVAELGAESAFGRVSERAPAGKIPTWNGEDIPAQVLADREAMARAGVAFVTVVVNGAGRPVAPATVSTRGVLDEHADAAVLRDAAREVTKALSERPWPRARPTDEEIADLARLVTRKRLEQRVGKRPVTVANVVREKP
ncbi:MAG TPA: ribonuclease J [Polyangiaceae bacterium]|nr:ribonuclease J [Polyangiaceae bacterium]